MRDGSEDVPTGDADPVPDEPSGDADPVPDEPSGDADPVPDEPSGDGRPALSALRRIVSEGSARFWTVVGGICAVLALVLTLITILPHGEDVVRTQAVPAPADLRVVGFSLADPTSVDADVLSGGDPTPAAGTSIKSSTIDLTLENMGDFPALITSATLTFHYQQRVADCRQSGGPVTISGSYSIKVPSQVQKVPFSVARPMNFEVKPKALDRMTITLGPQELGETEHWLYDFDLVLRTRDGQSIPAGRASVMSPPGEPANVSEVNVGTPGGAYEQECLKRVQTQLAHLGGTRAAELNTLADYINQFVRPGSPSSWRCADKLPGVVPTNLISACFRYSHWTIEAELRYLEPPTPALIALELGSPDGGLPYTLDIRTQQGAAISLDGPSRTTPYGYSELGGSVEGKLNGNSIRLFIALAKSFAQKSFSVSVWGRTYGSPTYGGSLVDHATAPMDLFFGSR
ncbi:hypothetical protein [Frankia sp. ACN1ag]|uniref:hypothetical protein n=1 Tax=Frankia sp. ACN1ag TaxID=102891 RepID=UPI00128EC351|nr:hypothetical protein [Frankia sp. ACN1ag]